MSKVACIGDFSIDYYVNQERYFLGGISLNVASNLSSLEISTDLYSTLGNDLLGDQCLKLLASTPFAHSMTRLSGQTTIQRIILTASGERQFDGYTVGVLADFAKNIKNLPLVFEQYDLIHVPLSDGIENIFEHIAKLEYSGKKAADFSIDANLSEDLISILKRYSNYFDLIFIGGDLALKPVIQSLALQYPEKTFVLTQGKDGADSFYHGVCLHQPAISVPAVVDTTGCGDAFQSGFIASWLKSPQDHGRALALGAKQAASIIGRIGATNLEITSKDFQS